MAQKFSLKLYHHIQCEAYCEWGVLLSMQCSCSPNSLLLTPLYVHGEVHGHLNHTRPETGNLDVVIVGFNNIWKTVPVPQLVPMQNMKDLQ